MLENMLTKNKSIRTPPLTNCISSIFTDIQWVGLCLDGIKPGWGIVQNIFLLADRRAHTRVGSYLGYKSVSRVMNVMQCIRCNKPLVWQ